MHAEDSISGYVVDGSPGEMTSARWTDLSVVRESGHCVLLRGKRHGRWWLLKGLRRNLADSETYRILLRKEFEILIRMQHQHIVAASDFTQLQCTDYDGAYIVMEWIEGEQLDEWLARRPPRSEQTRMLAQLLDAVDYIHAQGIVHRDIKPANIMVSNIGDTLKLIDFGLADSDSYAILKQPAGTPGYISPEQSSVAAADVRNDIYSIGGVMQRMRLGIAYRHIIGRCKGPLTARYANVGELRRAINNATGKTGAILLTVATIIAATVFLLWHSTSERSRENTVSQTTAVPAELPGKEGDVCADSALNHQSAQSLIPSRKTITHDETADAANTAESFAAANTNRGERTDSAISLLLAIYETEGSKVDATLDSMRREGTYDINPRILSAPSKAWKEAYYTRFKGKKEDEIDFDKIYFTLDRHHQYRLKKWNNQLRHIK